MADQRRRGFPIQVSATIVVGKRSQIVMTEEVSFQGLFVRTDTPPSLRQLIRLEVELPDGKKFKANAMAVEVVESGDAQGRTPGASLELYALGRVESETWQAFVESAKAASATPAAAAPTAPAVSPEPIRRRHPRIPARFQLRPRNIDVLYEMYTRDISKGGMFVMTAQPLAVGDPLQVEIIHPLTGETFELECEVRRIDPGKETPGMGLEFMNMTDARRTSLYEFVCSNIPEIDDSMLVSEDDDTVA